MFEKRLGDEGYATYKLPRTNNRGDGLLTAVNRKSFRVLNYRELLFNDFGNRVAQLLHVELVIPFLQSHAKDVKHDALVVNTPLLFPHNSSYCLPRLKQVYKILQYIESYQEMYQLQTAPIILCGDWNGSKRGHVYKFLRSQCFVSSYDTAHHYTDSDVDCHKWVSHRNHRGNICGVDFIWLLNPYEHRKPLNISFIKAVLGIIKNRLCEVSRESIDPFGFLENENCKGTCVDLSGFSQALTVLGLTGYPNGLDIEELHDLWLKLDTDGDGVIDFSQFKSALDPSSLLQSENENEALEAQTETPQNTSRSATIGFEVKHSALFPTQVEDGIWPEDYSLSDHAQLTVEFAPVTMHCPQSFCHPAQTMT
ncbi:uncharacterized calcium-binding protein At1g02270-like isoform X2 [Magnolia sinica]|nr:uncharacterized calcium-binding protein At1g02270-like isoform X2 [Magnolia sinica]